MASPDGKSQNAINMSTGMPIDDFRYLLSMKANISDFQTLYDLKSNRVDTE